MLDAGTILCWTNLSARKRVIARYRSSRIVVEARYDSDGTFHERRLRPRNQIAHMAQAARGSLALAPDRGVGAIGDPDMGFFCHSAAYLVCLFTDSFAWIFTTSNLVQLVLVVNGLFCEVPSLSAPECRRFSSYAVAAMDHCNPIHLFRIFGSTVGNGQASLLPG